MKNLIIFARRKPQVAIGAIVASLVVMALVAEWNQDSYWVRVLARSASMLLVAAPLLGLFSERIKAAWKDAAKLSLKDKISQGLDVSGTFTQNGTKATRYDIRIEYDGPTVRLAGFGQRYMEGGIAKEFMNTNHHNCQNDPHDPLSSGVINYAFYGDRTPFDGDEQVIELRLAVRAVPGEISKTITVYRA